MPGERCVLVKVGSLDFAIRERHVRCLETRCDCLPLVDPFEPWMRGWILVRRTVPAIDLGLRLGLQAIRQPSPAVIVRFQEQEAALLVARINDVALITPARTGTMRAQKSFSPFVMGVWRGRSRPCYLLDLAAVLAGLRQTFQRHESDTHR